MGLRSRSLAVIAALSLAVSSAPARAARHPSPQPDAEAAVVHRAPGRGATRCARSLRWTRRPPAPTTSPPSATPSPTAWDDVQASLTDVKASDKAAVEAGWAGLQAALKNIPSDVPIADAINGVKAAAVPLKAAYKEMADGMGCAIVTPY